ncbi:MAG: type II pantothenate kinase [Eubacteriales bacterium]
MKAVIGIDIGGSTTKIVGFDENGKLIAPIFVRANDQITSVYGALGRFTTANRLELSDIRKIMVTGVGSTFIQEPIYKIPCEHLVEFPCIGKGGLFLSGLDEAIVVSMGTGTALVHAKTDGTNEYLGGTGVGGGTLVGLSEKLLGMRDFEHIIALAQDGDLSRVDLRVSDITKQDVHPDLRPDLTASNFGKVSDVATKSDLALGIINMIFETVSMLAIFAARAYGTENIVITGNMTSLPQAKTSFDAMKDLFGLNFVIPENASFGTVIGAALSGF